MPDPITIGAAATAASTGFNALMTGRINKKTRQWNEKMYEKQKEDNYHFWQTQNEYNSPRAQMQRLQEAGLNPALMYGRGAGSDTAGAISTPSKPEWRPDTPTLDSSAISGGLSTYYNLEQTKAQTDNTRKLGTLHELDAVLKGLDATSKRVGIDQSRFDLNLSKELRNNSIEVANQQLRKLYQENAIMLTQEERAAAMHEPNLIAATEKVLQIRAATAHSIADVHRIEQAIKLMKKDGRIRDLNIELMEKGIYPSDGLISRIIGRYIPLDDVTNIVPKMFNSKPSEFGHYLNQNFKPFDWISRQASKAYDWWKK